MPFTGTDFDVLLDSFPFFIAGIPTGGLSTGDDEIKTEEARLWGGTAGQAFDLCYQQACNTYNNINRFAFNVNLHAVAAATLPFAKDPMPPGAGRGEAAGIAGASVGAKVMRIGGKHIRRAA